MTQGFSCLASTVPDSQGLEQIIDVSNSFKPLALLAPPTNPQLAAIRPLKKMGTQSSPHDTQELSPSYYENLIKANRSKSALGAAGIGQSRNGDDGVTQYTVHTGDTGHVDLGLSDKGSEEDDAQASDAELNSEPVEFSPTQATQARLSQFPESQRFKTPATNGKKRNSLGEVLDSPVLPRNPLARNGLTKTPVHVLGLSQAFAATQAGSSPFMTRKISEPTSDRPSPNIEMKARPVSASLSSPLRPRSELRKIITEPQSRYVSMKQSQAERERLESLRQQSSDAAGVNEQSDDDFDDEPSIVKRARLARQREENVRERFARFSSPTRLGSASKTGAQTITAARAEASSPIRTHSKRSGTSLVAEEQAILIDKRVTGDSEDETDVGEEEQVVIRHSSQPPRANDEEDKENVRARTFQVPETVARLHRIIDGQEHRDLSPTLRRSCVQPPVEQPRSSQAIGEAITNRAGITGSPTIAIANSQPDQSASRKILSHLSEPFKGFSGGSQISSSAVGAAQVGSSLCHNEGQNHHGGPRAQAGDDAAAGDQRQPEVNEHDVHQLHDRDVSDSPARTQIPGASNARPGDERHVDPPGIVPEAMSPRDATTNVATGSSDKSTTANGIRMGQQSSKYETAPTHLSSSTIMSRPLSSLFSSPSGKKRERLGDIAAQPSPKKVAGETEIEEVMAAMDDSEFYNAIGDVPGSSSPIPPGRNAKRQRLVDRLAVSSRATSTSADTNFLSSPPTSEVMKVGYTVEPASFFRSSRLPTKPPRRSEAIWDVQTSPPKPAPTRSTSNPVKEPKQSSRKASKLQSSRSLKSREITVAETAQSVINEKTDTVSSAQKPSENSTNHQESHFLATEVVAPNQVLARFNGNPRGYYPATCIGSTGLKSEGTFRYKIQWEDSAQDDIDELGIRRLDLRTGDHVKVGLKGWPRVSYIVQGFKDKVDKIVDGDLTDIRGFKTVVLKAKKRKSLPADVSTKTLQEAPMSAIYLDTNMWGQMKDRLFDINLPQRKTSLTLHIPPQVLLSRSGLTTPFSERPSTPNTSTSRKKRKSDFSAPPQPPTSTGTASPFPLPNPPTTATTKSSLFSNMAFAISYDDPGRRISFATAITMNGGTLLAEDFHEMFEQQQQQQRQSSLTSPHPLETSPLALNSRFASTGFVALIADRHSRKLKYMQSLALGIPALSGKWLDACIDADQVADWRPYLLAAGESVELEGAVRSRILPPMDPSEDLLRDIVSGRPNLLGGEAVIVVRGKGKAEEKRRLHVFLTKAAGAGRVETCADLKGVKALLDGDEEGRFRWVFADDKELARAEGMLLGSRGKGKGKGKEGGGLRVVGNEFLCQSLILGRLWQQR